MSKKKCYIYFEGKISVPSDDVRFTMMDFSRIINDAVRAYYSDKSFVRFRKHTNPDIKLSNL